MSKALLIPGLGLTLIGVGVYLHDCEASFVGGSCGSSSVADVLRTASLYGGVGDEGAWIGPLLGLPFSVTAAVLGVAASIVGGLRVLASL